MERKRSGVEYRNEVRNGDVDIILMSDNNILEQPMLEKCCPTSRSGSGMDRLRYIGDTFEVESLLREESDDVLPSPAQV